MKWSALGSVAAVFLGSTLAGAEAPKDADYNRAHAEEQFAAALSSPKFAAKHSVRVPSLTGDADKMKWHEIGPWEGYTLAYRRGSGSTVEVRATTAGTKPAHNKLVAVVRYHQQIPSAAFSSADKSYATAHWRSFRDASGLIFVQPSADYCTSYFTADREKGVISASAVAWGPAWKLDAKEFEIELALLNF